MESLLASFIGLGRTNIRSLDWKKWILRIRKEKMTSMTSMQVGMPFYLMVSSRLYGIGVRGRRVNRRSVLILLMCIELLLLAVNRQLIVYSVYRDDRMGQVFALMVLTVAAGESAVGLAILVVYFRVHGTIAMRSMNLLHG
jgi:NADH-quinone oxidoreductase subunit K